MQHSARRISHVWNFIIIYLLLFQKLLNVGPILRSLHVSHELEVLNFDVICENTEK